MARVAIPAEPIVPIYDWEPGYQYNCRFKVAAVVMGTERNASGSVLYTPTAEGKTTPTEKEPKQECTGTGFVVTANGVLVTCAHVVEGAIKIEAQFGKKKYVAKVLAFDAQSDLAVLKIEAKNLRFLPFLDSDKVELAQEIRVVGYPLSDMLGESIKMSRGTISGIIDSKDDNRFQIDARVNPGNSGGPLVDEQGRVVGIASELLTSTRIDSVGFAIPANEALALLETAKVKATKTPDGKSLKGPQLAKQVAPAVALLKVQTGPDGIGKHEQHWLNYTSFCHREKVLGSSKLHSGKLVVDSCGDVISGENEALVPFTFDSVATVGIERLPGDNRKTWKSFRIVTLSATDESESRSSSLPYYRRPPSYRHRHRLPHGGLRPPHLYSPYSQNERTTQTVKLIPAVEEVKYERVSQSADGKISISKEYRLHTLDKTRDGNSSLEMSTSGSLTWDKKIGCVRDLKMSGQLRLNRSGMTLRVPITLSYETTKKEKPKQEPAPPPARTKPSPPSKPDTKPPVVKKPPTAKPPVVKKPTSLEKAPASTGLNKFNPDD